MTLATALFLALTATQVDDAREQAVRHLIRADKAPDFRAYCLAIQNSQAKLPATREGQVDQLLKQPPEDATPWFLRRFRELPHRVIPQSSCTKVVSQGDEEVVESGKAGPALMIFMGPVDIGPDDRVRLVIFTTSGSLTETFTLYEVGKVQGQWKVLSTRILLQA